MITIKNVRTVGEEVLDYHIPSPRDYTLDAQGKLYILPGVIDPHACFGSIGTENWNAAVQSSIRGGVTTIIEVPSKNLSHNTRKELELKDKKIANSLSELGISLNYFHYLPYSEMNLLESEELGISRQLIKGIVIRLDSDKNEILHDHWDHLFSLAAQEDIPFIINSQNENSSSKTTIKSGESLLEKAIHYVEKWSNRLYVLNVSTKQEIDLIQEAKNRALLVYTETTPQHLFPEDSSKADLLWEAINNDVVETIGSGYDVNHQSQAKILYNGVNFSFSDPLFLLPLLLTAVHEKKISIDKVVRLTSSNIQDMLELHKSNNFVLVDLEKEQTITKIHSGHSTEMTLKGWPIYTIVNGQIFSQIKSDYGSTLGTV